MLWLVIGYLFLFVFRPFEYWPVLGEFRIERIYMLCLLVILFLWRQRRYIAHPINNSIIFFLIVLVVSSVLSFSWTDAYKATFDYFKLVVFYFVILLTIRDERQLKLFIIAYLAVMFLYVGKSAWEFFLHDRYTWRMGIKRLGGIDTSYGDPNAFAASIAYSLPFLWAMLKYKVRNPLVRKMLWTYGIVAGVSIVFTGSRSGMVTTLLFFMLVLFGTSRKITGVTLLLVLLAFVWNFMPLEYQSRFKSAFVKGAASKDAEVSAQGRLAGLKQGIKMFSNNPLLGIGPGNFKYGWDDRPIGMSAHNLYGELLGETGGAGFLAFFILVVLIVKTHRKVAEKAHELLGSASPHSPPVLPAKADKARLLQLVSTASVQAIILLLFNGNFGHNLYRYNWLWIGAIGVLSLHFLKDEFDKAGAPRTLKKTGFARHG